MSSRTPSRAAERTDVLERLSHQLGRELSARIVMFHSAIAEQLGLSITEHKALDLLSRSGPMPAGRLAEVTGLTSGAVTGMVDRLERAGFVKRSADPSDRRKVIIEAVEDRYADVAWIFASLAQAMGALLERYDDEELAVIADFCARLPELMRDETRKLREAKAGG